MLRLRRAARGSHRVELRCLDEDAFDSSIHFCARIVSQAPVCLWLEDPLGLPEADTLVHRGDRSVGRGFRMGQSEPKLQD